MEERQWIRAIQRGDKKYLQDIAEKYYDDIYRFCAFQAGSRTDAYDLAQETFLRFIKYAEGCDDRNLKGYLLTIAMNVCRDHWARQSREKRKDEEWRDGLDRRDGRKWGDSPERRDGWKWEDSLERGAGRSGGEAHRGSSGLSEVERRAIEADIHGRLMEALMQLPEMQREAILLHYLQGMKYREIGRMKKVTVSTVKSRVRQGMEKLQRILRKEDFLD